jgi:hypothetical protein
LVAGLGVSMEWGRVVDEALTAAGIAGEGAQRVAAVETVAEGYRWWHASSEGLCEGLGC